MKIDKQFKKVVFDISFAGMTVRLWNKININRLQPNNLHMPTLAKANANV